MSFSHNTGKKRNQTSEILCVVCQRIFTTCSLDWWESYPESLGVDVTAIQEGFEAVKQIADHPDRARWYPREHHISIASFENAVGNGCQLCLQFTTHFRLLKLTKKGEPVFPLRYYLGQTERVSRASQFRGRDRYTIFFDFGSGSGYRHDVHIVPLERWTQLDILAAKSLRSQTTGGPEVVEYARRLLNDCQSYHQSCGRDGDARWNPTRLLEISTDNIKIITPSIGSLPLRYATLSYCWGKLEFFMLKPETMPQLLHGVPIEHFPQMFQDTIRFVRQLEIRLLWIDSYCILQGNSIESIADWEQQADAMQQVYANAVVNIGAAHGHNPYEGLFQERERKFDGCLALQWQPSKVKSLEWYSVGDCSLDLETKLNELNSSHLMQRGWVLQECVLSPRMLTFNADNVLWQCTEHVSCEGIGSLPFAPRPDEFSGLKHKSDYLSAQWQTRHPFWSLSEPLSFLRINLGISDFRKQMKQYTTESRSLLQERWLSTLHTYSSTRLTFPGKDIFRAIEGLGQRFALRTQDLYHKGLLLDLLYESLVWEAVDTSGKFPDRAPSWHWASGGHVSFDIAASLLGREGRHPRYPLIHASLSWDFDRKFTSWPSLICIGRLVPGNSLRHVNVNLDTGNQVLPPNCFIAPVVANKETRKRSWIIGLAVSPLGNNRFSRLGLVHGNAKEFPAISHTPATFFTIE